MALATGARLGPYEIVGLLGAGGMGEVYKAHDHRLAREVAIKILPDSLHSQEQIVRFKREAQAAGTLNDPHIVAVFDTGMHEGTPYVVSELLNGRTLRDLMLEGPLRPRKAIEYAIQIALGLAAAHEQGVYHRDLKPGNIFVTRDGQIKLLDFGLAKFGARPPEIDGRLTTETGPLTGPAAILGTAGYAAPEQIRGDASDHRADIFSFGCTLHEMLCGDRAFHGHSNIELLTAILRDDPSPLATTLNLPAGLDHVVRRCLEKNPRERFQSARDLAFHLQQIQEEPRDRLPIRRGRRLGAWIPVALATALTLAAAALVFPRFIKPPTPPSFQQLTFRRGTIVSARFAPHEQTVVYSAAWEGEPLDLFQVLPGSPESRPLGQPGATLLAVANNGEMAVALGYRYGGGERFLGTLARVPPSGGAPREVLEDVEYADWATSTGALAVARSAGVGTPSRLEYPIGTVLYTTTGAIRDPRISPNGDLVAFFDDSTGVRSSGAVAVVDRAGAKRTLSREWTTAHGLAWSPAGNEIWFTAGGDVKARALRAVSLDGQERLILQTPGSLLLHDIAHDGRALLTHEAERSGILASPPGAQERELSWLDDSRLADIGVNRAILFGDRTSIYLRRFDGSAPVRLGEGYADKLSPDGKWVLSTTLSTDQLMLLATGAGQARVVARHGIESYAGAWWFPTGTRILFNGRKRGRGLRAYMQDLDGGRSQPLTPEGTWALSVSPDGQLVAAVTEGKGMSLYPVDGQPARPVRGSQPGDRPGGWSLDGTSLWVFRRGEMPASIHRLALATGHRSLWKRLVPVDPAGVTSIMEFRITPDEKFYAYSYRRLLSDLYLVTNLK
jgi:serine/threonine protein kinase